MPELRGADLFGNAGVWGQLDTKACNDLYRRAVDLLPQHGCELADVRIDREALDAQHRDPHRHHLLALQFLAEELDAWLGTQRDPLRQRALLVAAQTHHDDDFAIGLVANVQKWGSSIGPQRKLTRIVDTVHFVRSIDNPGVQLADLVAYALHRMWTMAPPARPWPGRSVHRPARRRGHQPADPHVRAVPTTLLLAFTGALTGRVGRRGGQGVGVTSEETSASDWGDVATGRAGW